MENTENGCYILKKKEYEELLKKVKENKSKEIRITYNFNYSYNLSINGDFILGSDLHNQIARILQNIGTKISDDVKISYTNGFNASKTKTIESFEELPWYKRLFFKKKYIE